ncbi:phosphatase PAP2 family protein [Streptomyces sp. NPDC089919]|uniref:phosphatase PAP2 family protein n=1 Tax=Streptomyces sp. NPDC089919 TaxID=3155188 RepID=UPI0034325AA6
MAGLATGGPNPDVSLLHDINGIAASTPGWVDRLVAAVGEYGLIAALVLLVLWCWRGARRQPGPEATESFVALVWAPLAAGLALLVNIPLRSFVGRPRPFAHYPGIHVLASGRTGFSFVSDHATLTMALGVGLFVAHRKYGLIGIGLALLEGFCRVYTGAHYPTDVIGGFALGTAVVLLFAPPAIWLLTPVVRAVAGSPRAGRLVRSRTLPPPRPVELAASQGAEEYVQERDLAA